LSHKPRKKMGEFKKVVAKKEKRNGRHVVTGNPDQVKSVFDKKQ